MYIVSVLAGLFIVNVDKWDAHVFKSLSGFRKNLDKHHVSSSFDDVEKQYFSHHQSVHTSYATNVDESTENLEAESKLSLANLVNSCANVISDK